MLKKFIAWLKSWRMSGVDLDLMGTPCRSFEDAGRRFLKEEKMESAYLVNGEKLRRYIVEFPNKFDNTDIARQLVEAAVTTQLYVDVKRTWANAIRAREELAFEPINHVYAARLVDALKIYYYMGDEEINRLAENAFSGCAGTQRENQHELRDFLKGTK